MSSSIDERIVKMQFDNGQFENGAKTSLKTLEDLKKGLNFDDTAKSLSNLGNVSNSLSFNELQNGVQSIADRFSTLGIVAMTSISRITNSLITLGEQMVNTLTGIQAMKDGFAEYTMQIESTQMILANTKSKGSTIDDVNKALDELNTYADQTIYNFSQMTQNIGKFTAAGVDLETSVSAIKGIANAAALAGADSTATSRAMYQLSQALGNGYVRLQDWMSVENSINSESLRDVMIETSRALGTGVDEAMEKYGSFRESLTQGEWLTTDVLTQGLEIFTGDLTEADLVAKGFSKDVAASMVEVGKTATESATVIKTIPQLMDVIKEEVGSGWAKTWQIVMGDYEEAKKLFTEVGGYAQNAIGQFSQSRNNILEAWKALGGRDDVIEGLKNSFNGLLSIINPIHEAFRDVFPPQTAARLHALSKNFKELSSKFKIGDKDAKNLQRTFKGVFSIVDLGVRAVGAMASAFGDLLVFVSPAASVLLEATGALGDFVSSIDEGVKKSKKFSEFVSNLESSLSPVANGLKNFATNITNAFKAVNEVDISGIGGFLGLIKARISPLAKLAEIVSGVFSTFVGWLKSLAPALSTVGGFIASGFSTIGKSISDTLSDMSFSEIFDLINGGLIALILKKIKDFVYGLSDAGDETEGIVDNIKGVLDGARTSLETWQNNLKSDTLKKLAVSIAILAGSLVVLSLIESDKLAVALGAISVLFLEVFGAMKAMDKLGNGKSNSMKGLLTLSVGILVLSSAVKKLGSLNPEELATGLTGIALLLGELGVFLTYTDFDGLGIRKGTGLILMATSLVILTNAVKILSGLDVDRLSKGLISIGILLGELGVFMNSTDLDGAGVLKGVGIMAIAEAITILAKSVGTFGSMDPEELAKGLGSVALILTELAAFIKVTDSSKGLIATGTGMTILAASMLIFAKVLGQFGSMSLEQIGKGLLAMGGALTELAVALNFIPNSTAVKAVGLVIVAQALSMLTTVLSNLGGMSMEEIGLGLVALAGSLTIIAIALATMQGAIGGAAALIVVAGALSLFVPVLMTLGSTDITTVVQGLLSLAAIFTLLGAAGVLLGPLIPVLLGLGAAMMLIGGGVALLGVGLASVGGGLISLSAGIASVGALIMGAGALIIGAISKIISSLVGFAKNFLKLGFNLVKNIANGITKGLGLPKASITNVVAGITTIISKAVTTVFNIGKKIVTNFAKAIKSGASSAKNAATNVINAAKNAITDKISSFKEAGKNVIQGFIDGLNNKISDIKEKASSLASSFIGTFNSGLGNASPSKKTRQSAVYVAAGFLNELKSQAKNMKSSASNLAGSFMGAFDGALDSDTDYTPVIRPVLDLTDVTSGISTVDSMMSNFRLMGQYSMNNAQLAYAGTSGFQNRSVFAQTDNSDVVTAISELREDVSTLREAMAEWKIVMDTGATVGALTGPMDKALGARTLRKKRRGG